MIVDIHTHVGEYPAHIGETFAAQAREAWAEVALGGTHADVSALVGRRWLLYQALVAAVEYRVTHKLLFGTDFPFFTATQTIDGLRSVAGEAFGARMPTIDPDVIEGIIHRPSLELLGID